MISCTSSIIGLHKRTNSKPLPNPCAMILEIGHLLKRNLKNMQQVLLQKRLLDLPYDVIRRIRSMVWKYERKAHLPFGIINGPKIIVHSVGAWNHYIIHNFDFCGEHLHRPKDI